jgi:hypothetical protein
MQHTQLVSQQHNLGFQSRLRLEWRDQDVDEQDQERDHHAISLADLAAHASPDEVLGMDNWYWQIGLITTAYGLDFNLAYTDTSIEPSGCGNTNYCAGRFFVNVTKVF